MQRITSFLMIFCVWTGCVGQGSSSSIPDLGELNKKATKMSLLAYPPAARKAGACGSVLVKVTINRKGLVAKARVVHGHSLLRAVTLDGARRAEFPPSLFECDDCRYVSGTLKYNFVCQGSGN